MKHAHHQNEHRCAIDMIVFYCNSNRYLFYDNNIYIVQERHVQPLFELQNLVVLDGNEVPKFPVKSKGRTWKEKS